MAPWKTIETVRQRRSRQPVGVRRCSSITPRSERSVISPAVRRSPLGSRPSSASAVVVLPHPDSPASPSASPRREREADAVDDRHDGAGILVGDLEIADVEQRLVGHARSRRPLGLTISSSAFPVRLNAIARSVTQMPGGRK